MPRRTKALKRRPALVPVSCAGACPVTTCGTKAKPPAAAAAPLRTILRREMDIAGSSRFSEKFSSRPGQAPSSRSQDTALRRNRKEPRPEAKPEKLRINLFQTCAHDWRGFVTFLYRAAFGKPRPVMPWVCGSKELFEGTVLPLCAGKLVRSVAVGSGKKEVLGCRPIRKVSRPHRCAANWRRQFAASTLTFQRPARP